MASKDDMIADLRRRNAQQAQQIDDLTKRVAELELQLAKASKNSSNSSKSPSSDIVKPPKKKTDRRKKARRGGQKGHPRKLRELLPTERVNETITYEINAADVRELGLTPTDDFDIIQHIELLDLPIHVTEHRLRKYLDGDGSTILPDVPELKDRTIFGPRMLSMIGWLKSRAHCSYSTIAVWMSDVLQVQVSRGYLAKLCNGIISTSLADAYDEIKQAIRDIRFLLKHPDKKTKAWAEQLLDRSRRMFSAWHRRDQMTDAGFHRSMITHRDRFLEIIWKPPDSKEAENLTERFLIVELVDGGTYDMSQDYFRFMFAPGVEPTNNPTEQQVRHCVIDRRITQGTRSESGQRYHERMWTGIATCDKQGRSFFHFLHESLTAILTGMEPPSLLPS